MSRYRSKNAGARARQDAVFTSLRLCPPPRVQGRWLVLSVAGTVLATGDDWAALRALAQAVAAVVLPGDHPLPLALRARPASRLESAWDLERAERRAERRAA